MNYLLPLFMVFFISCNGQNKATNTETQSGPRVGGPCETCEYIDIGKPAIIMTSDTSEGWYESDQKLIVNGRVLHSNGKDPASDIILYYWQTNDQGLYQSNEQMPQAARRHGHIRGWVKTEKNGRFQINTNVPAPYPANNEPQHIHVLIKEPSLPKEYYIDAWNLEGDTLLTPAYRNSLEQRGGDGIMKVESREGIWLVENHEVILGKNIPNHPQKN